MSKLNLITYARCTNNRQATSTDTLIYLIAPKACVAITSSI